MFSCSLGYRNVADSALNNAVCWWTSVQKQRLRTGHSSLKQASELPRAFFQQEPGTPSRAEHGKVEQTNRRPQRRSGLFFLRGALAANVEVTDTVPLRLSHAVCALTWRSRPRVSQNFRDFFWDFFEIFCLTSSWLEAWDTWDFHGKHGFYIVEKGRSPSTNFVIAWQ